MKGDFSRMTFDPKAHFARVLLQQGRVTLDADVNEQAAILLHYVQTLARDLFGPHGGPSLDSGFGLVLDTSESKYRLRLSPGHYYVDGILCETEGAIDYADQADYPRPEGDAQGNGGDPFATWLKNQQDDDSFWVYLDVWERHISWIEDDRIREVALGGPDTSTRSKVVWQVKAIPWDTGGAEAPSCDDPLSTLPPISDAMLAVRLDPGLQMTDPCVLPPDAKYRGAENQLYRVEIHMGGAVGDDPQPTFKWSRDNGSVATRWLGTEGDDLVVANARRFGALDWVEVSDDVLDLNGLPGTLVKLANVEGDRLTVDPATVDDSSALAWTEERSNPKLRRWDQRASEVTALVGGAVPIAEGTENSDWIDLEDGLQVRFSPGGTYRTGDYWVIPARVATGGIEWPAGPEAFAPPLGIAHHYAPLGFVFGGTEAIQDCRSCAALAPGDCALPVIVDEVAAFDAPVPERSARRAAPRTAKRTRTPKPK